MAEITFNSPVATPPADDIVDVATNSTYSSGPFPGSANKVVPTSAINTDGFVPGQEPPAESFNYIFNNHQQHLDFAQQNIINLYEYKTPGSYELEIPQNIGCIRIIAVGGGGAGGSGGGYINLGVDNTVYGGGGGGGSGYLVDYVLPFYPYDSGSGTANSRILEIIVGDGGSGVDSSVSRGGNGEASQVYYKDVDPDFPTFGPGNDNRLIVNAAGGGGGYTSIPLTAGLGAPGGEGWNGGGGGGAGYASTSGTIAGGAGGLAGIRLKDGDDGSDTIHSGGAGGQGWYGSMGADSTKQIITSGYGLPQRYPLDRSPDPTFNPAGGGQGGSGANGHFNPQVGAVDSANVNFGRAGVGYGAGGAGAGAYNSGGNWYPGISMDGHSGCVFIEVYPLVYRRIIP